MPPSLRYNTSDAPWILACDGWFANDQKRTCTSLRPMSRGLSTSTCSYQGRTFPFCRAAGIVANADRQFLRRFIVMAAINPRVALGRTTAVFAAAHLAGADKLPRIPH